PVSPLGETAERLAAMRLAQVQPEGMANQGVGTEHPSSAESVFLDKPVASPTMSSVEVDYVTTRDKSAPPTIEFQRASEPASGGCQTDYPEQLTPRTPNSLVSEGFAHDPADAPEQPSSAESVFIDKPAAPNKSPTEADEVHYLPSGSAGSAETTSRLRGIGLFAAVFDELSNRLGKEFSTAELMQAA